MSTLKSSAENLTLNADGANNDIKFQSNGVEKASIDQDGVIATGGAALDGAVAINASNADVDFKVGCETGASNVDTEDYALWVEGSTGNVVMGSDTNTDDSVNLLVTRSGLTTMEIYASEDSSARDAVLRLHTRNGAAQCRIRFLDGAAPGTTAGEIYYNHDGDTMYFHTAGTQRAQLNSNGLCFNADTAAANALNDYEEGSWTPTMTGYGGTNNVQAGTYVIIGGMCFFSLQLGFNGSDGSVVSITLPVTSKNLGTPAGGGYLTYNTYVSGQSSLEQMMPYIGSNSSALGVHINQNTNQTYNGLGAAGGQCYYYFTGQYQV